jgi:hypothetical protein
MEEAFGDAFVGIAMRVDTRTRQIMDAHIRK